MQVLSEYALGSLRRLLSAQKGKDIVIIKDSGEAVSVANWESSFQKQVSER